MVWEQCRNSVQEMRPGAVILQKATRVCRPCFSGTRAWAEEVQPWAGGPWGSRRSWHSEPIQLYRLILGVHNIQQFLPLVDHPTNHCHHGSPWGIPLRLSFTHYNPLASFFVTHGISSPSSTSHRRSCSPREFTFHLFSSTTKVTQGLPWSAESS
jgi:hypothetical protein